MPFSDEWVSQHEQVPFKGQIVEVLVWKPAIFNGVNEYGSPQWNMFNEVEQVYYWRIPQDARVFAYVKKRMHERH